MFLSHLGLKCFECSHSPYPATNYLPATGNSGLAVGAVPCLEIVFEDSMPVALNQEFFAVWAISVGGFGVDVAFVNVVESGGEGDFAGAVESFGRGARFVLKLEVGMEGSEVQRDIWAQLGDDPVG